MIEQGDIYLADLGAERRRHVLVLSSSRFARLSGRALVAPERDGSSLGRRAPWHIDVDDQVFAVELALTVREELLLDRVGRAPFQAMLAARRAIISIT